jgi:hypothetical protein
MGFAIFQGTGMGRKWQAIPIPTPVPQTVITPVPTVKLIEKMEIFKNSKYKYTIMKPIGWEATPITTDKNFDDRQVFLPNGNNGEGSIIELSVTVISKPASVTEIATDADWNKWVDSPTGATDSSGLVKKIGEKMVGGQRAMVLWQDKDLPNGYDFSILTWVRKGTVNYYIDALGTGKFTDYESGVFDYISGTFTTL